MLSGGGSIQVNRQLEFVDLMCTFSGWSSISQDLSVTPQKKQQQMSEYPGKIKEKCWNNFLENRLNN